MTRKQIYDEVWEISVAGMAKKYAISYIPLLKQIKAANIPIPPSGYWTKLAHGKPTEKSELPGSPDALVKLYDITPGTRKKKQAIQEPIGGLKATESIASVPAIIEGEPIVETDEELQTVPKTRERYGQTFNIYNREELYRESKLKTQNFSPCILTFQTKSVIISIQKSGVGKVPLHRSFFPDAMFIR